MVALTVTPSKGNAGARYYPHSGHLGLTPVKVEGVVRTRVEEDGKPATASAVTVSLRCYEARVGRVGVVKSNILVEQSLTLWSPPSGAVWGSLGATELPFKIVLPANAAGNSTFSLQEYRVYWRIEAAIHTPHIPGIGTRQVKCFDVNLVRYNKPSTSTLPRRAALARPSEVHNSAHYELEFPRQSAAPLDPIPVSLRIHPRHGTSVQRVTFALERRIDMFDASPASSMQQLPSPGPLMRQISRESSPSESSTTLACSSSTTALLPASPREERPSSSRKRSPSPASQGLAAKTAELVLATAEVADIPKDGLPLQDGLCTVNASLQVPLPKSNAHWGVGETMQGGLARVRFYITAKVQIAWASGSDTVDACQQEVSVVAVDDAERLRVHNKYSMKRPATSPSATENQEEVRRPVPHLPSPPPSPGHSLPASRSGKAARRPHTASGARDASQRRALPLRPRSRGNEAAVFEPESVRAWERELDRIAPVAQRPRSSSALRLFSSKKQRSPEPRADLSLKSSIGVARPVVVPSTRTAEVLEWEAEVERFSSASAREAVLKGHASRAPLSV